MNNNTRKRPDSSVPNLIKYYSIVFVSSAIIIFIYESVKHLLMPGLSTLGSHLITIAGIAGLVTLTAFYVRRKTLLLTRQLMLSKEALSESENRFKRFFNEDLTGDFITDSHGVILDCNRAFIEIFGYEFKEELTGKNIDVLFPEFSANESLTALFAKESKLRNIEITARRKDGKMIHLLINVFIMSEDGGDFTGFKGFVSDITRKKETELELKKSEEIFKSMNQIISAMNDMKDMPEIYGFITETLHNRFPDTIILYISVDEPTEMTQLESVSGLNSILLNQVIEISGYELVGSKFKLVPGHKLYFKSGQFIEFKGGLAEFSSNQFPAIPANLLEKLIGLNRIYTIGINKDSQTLGAIHFLSLKNTEINDISFIELFTTQAATILQRKSAESALKESEKNYKNIIENLNDLFYRTDKEGRLVMASPSCLKVFGYSRLDQVIGLKVEDFYKYPEVRNEFLALIKSTGKVRNFCATLVRTDGTEVLVETTASILTTASGEFNGVEGISRDITERRKAEEALSRSEEQFRQLLNSTAEGIYGIDVDGNCTFCNNTALKILGYSEVGELLGKNLHYMIHHTGKNSKTINATDCRIFKAFTEGMQIHTDDEIFWRKNGENFPVEYWSYPIIRDGIVSGAVVTFFDISEKIRTERVSKTNEERWKFALEVAGDGIWDWNIETGEVYYSSLWKKMLGYDEAEISNSMSEWQNRVHPDDMPKCMLEFQQHFENKIPFFSNIHRLLCKDGSYKWVYDRGKVIERNQTGNPVRVIGINTDLTQKMQHEQKLRELNATKDKLFSVIAHDLRSPIGSIMNFSEMLCKNLPKYSATEVIDYVRLINSTSERTLDLLDNLLVWARMQTGKIDFNPESIQLQDVFGEIISILQPHALLKDITINSYYHGLVNCNADLNMLKTILRNLLQNAIKFTHKGGKIDARVISTVSQTEITVTDNGIGMDQETQDNLFNSDFKFSYLGTDGEKGSGVGLLLCHEFVARHGGKMWVNSTPGKGSTFGFTLPREEPVDLKSPDLQEML